MTRRRLFKRAPGPSAAAAATAVAEEEEEDGLGLCANNKPATTSRRSTSGSDSSTTTTDTTATSRTTVTTDSATSLHRSGSIRKQQQQQQQPRRRPHRKRQSYPVPTARYSNFSYTLPELDTLPRLDLAMETRRNAPLPPLPTRSSSPPTNRSQTSQTSGRADTDKDKPRDTQDAMEEDYESDGSIQPSPVLDEPRAADAKRTGASALHSTGTAGGINSFCTTTPLAPHHAMEEHTRAATTSYGGAAEAYSDDEQPASPSRIKNMFPRLGALYRPLDAGETKRLAPPQGGFYDLPEGQASALSFNQESARTEAELVSRSVHAEKENSAPVSDNASLLRKSLVSPFGRLAKRSSKNLRSNDKTSLDKALPERTALERGALERRAFDKKASFDEMTRSAVPTLPALSLDESQFGDSLASDDDIRSHSQSERSERSERTSKSYQSYQSHSEHSYRQSDIHYRQGDIDYQSGPQRPLEPAYSPPPVPANSLPPSNSQVPQVSSQMATIRATMGINYGDSDSSDNSESDDEELSLLPLSPLAPPTKPPSAYTPGLNNSKIMTKSQFDSYRKSIIENGLTNKPKKKTANDNTNEDDDHDNTTAHRDNGDSSDPDSEEDEAEEEEEEKEEEEEELKLKDKYDDLTDAKKQQIRMRLRQDAHLSVYRQKMTRVSGSSTALSALNMRASQSFGHLDAMANEDEDEDEDELDDVPLGILKAHGFPQPAMPPRQALKSTNSQPNLQGDSSFIPPHGGGGGPSILYKPSDAQSLRSVRSNGNLGGPPRVALPSAYNGGTQVGSRGLIGEIAIAEEARERRKSMGVNVLNQQGMRSSTMMNSTYTPSLYNSTGGTPPPQQQDVQQQMLQMMQMQVQLLQEMKGQAPPPPAAAPMMYQQQQAAPPQLQPQQQQQQHQQYMIPPQYAPSQYQMPPPGRPASVRSYSPSERSMQGGRGHLMHQRTNSNPAPTLKDLASQEAYRMSYARPQSQPFAYQTQPRPSSMMRINNAADENEDEDEDDEKEWQEMVKKRQGLKQSWKNRIVA